MKRDTIQKQSADAAQSLYGVNIVGRDQNAKNLATLTAFSPDHGGDPRVQRETGAQHSSCDCQQKTPSTEWSRGLFKFKRIESKTNQFGQVPQPVSRTVRSAPLVVPSPVMSPPGVPQLVSSVVRSAPLRTPSLL